MLVEIASPEFDVDFDIAYATPNNFTGKPVYARPGCYLHADAADLLQRAISLARPLGLRLKVFDAFRPSEAQWVLWEHTPDSDFLAHPERGSPHSMGAAVDLTLLDANDAELDMGTGFDDFTPRAFHGDLDISPDAQRNRIILMGIMTSAGWDFFRNEWWHYQLFNARDYDLIGDSDLPEPMMPPGAKNGESV